MTIGQRIKKLRLERGLSQAQLANTIGISQVLISQLEVDKGTGTKHVASLAHVLKVNALWLETGQGKPDLDYTLPNEITKNYCSEIKEVIKLMESTDNRGREKVLIAVKDALDAHNAFINSLPRAHDAEGDKIEQLTNRRLGQELLTKVIKNEDVSSDAYINEKIAEAQKDKRH